MNVPLVCEDNIEGIMTAIYDGWVYMNKGYSVNIHPGSDYAPTFFSKFINIETDNSKAERVIRSIKIKISEEAYIAVFRTCMNFAEDKGDAVFEFLRYGYRYGARVMKMLHVPAVMRVMELSRKTSNEAHSFIEFIRFEELKGNVLYSRIEPKCDVLSQVYAHFQNRFPNENWIIYDQRRIKAAVHQKGMATVLVEGQNMDQLVKSVRKDDEYEDLWKIFFNTIAIKERYNPKCQCTHLPKWYRKNMLEHE